MPKLRSVAPEMPLYIEENYTAVLRKKLKQCELDAIIVALPFNEPDVVTLPLYDEPFVVLLPKGHELSKLQVISSDMLATENLLMLGPGHCFRDQVLAACPNILNSIGLPEIESESKQKLITEGLSLIHI